RARQTVEFCLKGCVFTRSQSGRRDPALRGQGFIRSFYVSRFGNAGATRAPCRHRTKRLRTAHSPPMRKTSRSATALVGRFTAAPHDATSPGAIGPNDAGKV